MDRMGTRATKTRKMERCVAAVGGAAQRAPRRGRGKRRESPLTWSLTRPDSDNGAGAPPGALRHAPPNWEAAATWISGA
eukprot:1736284-Pyramimonas_sp.AAC.1